MPVRLPRHGCGGILRATGVNVARESGDFVLAFYGIPGRRCSKCGTEIVERNTAVALEKLENTSAYTVHVARTRQSGFVYTASTPTMAIGRPSETSGVPVSPPVLVRSL